MTTQEYLFGTVLCPVNKKELARIIGVAPSTLSRWAKDPGTIPLDKFKAIVKARGCSEGDIVKMVKER